MYYSASAVVRKVSENLTFLFAFTLLIYGLKTCVDVSVITDENTVTFYLCFFKLFHYIGDIFKQIFAKKNYLTI
jgi:hypothetical protein